MALRDDDARGEGQVPVIGVQLCDDILAPGAVAPFDGAAQTAAHHLRRSRKPGVVAQGRQQIQAGGELVPHLAPGDHPRPGQGEGHGDHALPHHQLHHPAMPGHALSVVAGEGHQGLLFEPRLAEGIQDAPRLGVGARRQGVVLAQVAAPVAPVPVPGEGVLRAVVGALTAPADEVRLVPGGLEAGGQRRQGAVTGGIGGLPHHPVADVVGVDQGHAEEERPFAPRSAQVADRRVGDGRVALAAEAGADALRQEQLEAGGGGRMAGADADPAHVVPVAQEVAADLGHGSGPGHAVGHQSGLVRRPARGQAGARGAADRGRAVGAGEAHARPREGVEVGGAHPLVAGGGLGEAGLLIGEDEQDVRRHRSGGQGWWGGGRIPYWRTQRRATGERGR